LLKIEPEDKYKEAQNRISERDKNLSKKNSKIENNNSADTNRKMVQQLNLNRKLFGDNIQNYTAVCEDMLDESVMKLYHDMKIVDACEEEEDVDEEEEEEEEEE
jgi:hypothetical protein